MSSFLLFIILGFGGRAQAQDTPTEIPDPSLVSAQFSEVLQYDARPNSFGSFGVAVSPFNGSGILYQHNIGKNRYLRLQTSHEFNSRMWVKDFTPTESVGNSEVQLRSGHQIQIGVDQILPFSKSGQWGFILGAGLGFERSEYQADYNPRLCVWGTLCGFDPKIVTSRFQRDQFGFINARLGIVRKNYHPFGIKTPMNVAVATSPVLLRTGENKFIDLSGNEVKLKNWTPIFVELTLVL